MNGVVYIAFISKTEGNKYIKEAIHSARSVKKFHPTLSITLLTDVTISNDCFDFVQKVRTDNIRIKQEVLSSSPYSRTLYLDSDTEIKSSILDLFDLLERFDLAATHDLIRKDNKKSKIWKKYSDLPESFSELGGGVILFNKSNAIMEFFYLWRKNYKEWCDASGKVNDQPSFRVSVWEASNLKLYILPEEYNKRFKNYDNIIPRIDHRHGLYK